MYELLQKKKLKSWHRGKNLDSGRKEKTIMAFAVGVQGRGRTIQRAIDENAIAALNGLGYTQQAYGLERQLLDNRGYTLQEHNNLIADIHGIPLNKQNKKNVITAYTDHTRNTDQARSVVAPKHNSKQFNNLTENQRFAVLELYINGGQWTLTNEGDFIADANSAYHGLQRHHRWEVTDGDGNHVCVIHTHGSGKTVSRAHVKTAHLGQQIGVLKVNQAAAWNGAIPNVQARLIADL